LALDQLPLADDLQHVVELANFFAGQLAAVKKRFTTFPQSGA
jgi:hypothetical protein